MVKLKFTETKDELKLDLGAGKGLTTPTGFTPVDIKPFEGVTVVDLRQKWPWDDESVDEAQCNYLVQLLTARERVHFANELYRVLKPGAKATVLTPHWCAAKAYGDIRVQWPPVSEYWYPTLNKAMREANQIDDTYTCDFEFTIGYGMHPAVVTKHEERQHDMLSFSKEAAQDLIATLTKLG